MISCEVKNAAHGIVGKRIIKDSFKIFSYKYHDCVQYELPPLRTQAVVQGKKIDPVTWRTWRSRKVER